jgi:hypothetical protein
VVSRFVGLQSSGAGGGALGFIHGWTAVTADLRCFSDPAMKYSTRAGIPCQTRAHKIEQGTGVINFKEYILTRLAFECGCGFFWQHALLFAAGSVSYRKLAGALKGESDLCDAQAHRTCGLVRDIDSVTHWRSRCQPPRTEPCSDSTDHEVCQMSASSCKLSSDDETLERRAGKS